MMAPGGGAREGDAQGGAHGCAEGAAARRVGRFHVQQRRSRGAAALLVPLASRGRRGLVIRASCCFVGAQEVLVWRKPRQASYTKEIE